MQPLWELSCHFLGSLCGQSSSIVLGSMGVYTVSQHVKIEANVRCIGSPRRREMYLRPRWRVLPKTCSISELQAQKYHNGRRRNAARICVVSRRVCAARETRSMLEVFGWLECAILRAVQLSQDRVSLRIKGNAERDGMEASAPVGVWFLWKLGAGDGCRRWGAMAA